MRNLSHLGPALACGLAAAAVAQDDCRPEWTGLDGGAQGFGGATAFATFDEGRPGPPSLFICGGFEGLAGVPANRIARWDGWGASDVGGGLSVQQWGIGPTHLNAWDDAVGNIPRGVYVGGNFNEAGECAVNNLARWEGGQWYDVGGGVTSFHPNVFAYAMATARFDEDGAGPMAPMFYVGGEFEYAGGVPARCIARWDGEFWTEVGGGVALPDPQTRPDVFAMAIYDDGRGPALYIAGGFFYAGGQTVYHIARWDGQSWEPLGGPIGGLDGTVRALCVFDEDGEGTRRPALYACGEFSKAVGSPDPIFRIARWDGHAWSAVGDWNASGGSLALAVFQAPDDERPNLYMGGYFSVLPDGTKIKGIARWSGEVWRDVDFGVSGDVTAFGVFDEDGDGPNPGGLYVGGMFGSVGTKGVFSPGVARWGCPLPPLCEGDLDRNGSLDLFDFLAFLNLFNAEDPTADCTADGALDLFDFLCFTNAFNAGC